jgi:excinuclease ABC subunit B
MSKLLTPQHKPFKLVSDYKPTGDQPKAIEQLVKAINAGEKHQTLLGATGTGKTFTMANVIQQIQRPTLVLAHNKTLAAQLCSEFQNFFPDNAVSYFVSYYDYYQPEAYLPTSDTYIEKDASINEEIEKYRHAATFNLLTRRDVLIVASVSCIYGLGNVEDYEALAFKVDRGMPIKRDQFLRRLTDIQYRRSAMDFKQGMFHAIGDTVEVFPPSGDTVIRFEMPFDEIENIQEVDSFTGELISDLQSFSIFPASHNVTTQEKIDSAIAGIKNELAEREKELLEKNELVKAERIRSHTDIATENLFRGLCDIVRDDGAVGMGEVGTGIARGHIESAILAVAIERDEWLFFPEIGCADFLRDSRDGFPIGSVPEEAADIHENGGREMLSLLRGVHIHRVLTEYARSAVDHEEVVSFLHAQLLCR